MDIYILAKYCGDDNPQMELFDDMETMAKVRDQMKKTLKQNEALWVFYFTKEGNNHQLIYNGGEAQAYEDQQRR